MTAAWRWRGWCGKEEHRANCAQNVARKSTAQRPRIRSGEGEVRRLFNATKCRVESHIHESLRQIHFAQKRNQACIVRQIAQADVYADNHWDEMLPIVADYTKLPIEELKLVTPDHTQEITKMIEP